MLRLPLHSICLPVILLCLAYAVNGQRIAILAPDETEANNKFAELLEPHLSDEFTILDSSMSRAAYSSVEAASPFNMTAEQAAAMGKVIGCDLYILLRSATMRRSAFGRAEYYEAFAAAYVVSARTGRLVLWKLRSFEAGKPADAEQLLHADILLFAGEITAAIRSAAKTELAEADPPMEEPPDEGSLGAKGFRSPVPYRRIKPEYTTAAALYDVTATVEILVDLDASGTVLRTLIVRWAGYGLDESVERTVRKMNWRPAERNGKTLPMRFLLRYNFKKAD